ncbi:MAG: DHHA1 domain-containing protein, partial [Thermodesulfobacteriota bacterium]
MEVITTHTHADFDTLASMVAAKKLYPGARLAFPGSLEKGLGKAIETIELPYGFERARDMELDSITRLILVDIRQASRIGPFAKVVGREGVDIHVYDHHPPAKGDVRGSLDVYERYGSTTTILTLLIRKRELPLTPVEATVMMAGIYEDTGSLGFTSTTPKDYEAAAFLLECGADLKRVSDLLKKELTPDEVSALNELLTSETTYTVGGVDVTIATVSAEEFGGEVSTLAHRLVDIEGLRCLFLLAELKDRVHMVARSAVPELDAGEVARALGGGGHPTAAAATLKGMTLIEAKEKTLAAVRAKVIPRRTAGDIMSAPAITVPVDTPLRDAYELMRRYGINALPVVDKEE